jgi:hypothetical protein
MVCSLFFLEAVIISLLIVDLDVILMRYQEYIDACIYLLLRSVPMYNPVHMKGRDLFYVFSGTQRLISFCS